MLKRSPTFRCLLPNKQREPQLDFPLGTDQIPRPIPEQPWYLSDGFSIIIGGILPFGACFVELFFMLNR